MNNEQTNTRVSIGITKGTHIMTMMTSFESGRIAPQKEKLS